MVWVRSWIFTFMAFIKAVSMGLGILTPSLEGFLTSSFTLRSMASSGVMPVSIL